MPITACEHKDRPHYGHGFCKPCYNRSWQKKNDWPKKMREYNLRNKYGMTQADYETLLKAQNDCCAICGETNPNSHGGKNFHVDHCHKTGEVRGLLCAKCNTGLGGFKDDSDCF